MSILTGEDYLLAHQSSGTPHSLYPLKMQQVFSSRVGAAKQYLPCFPEYWIERRRLDGHGICTLEQILKDPSSHRLSTFAITACGCYRKTYQNFSLKIQISFINEKGSEKQGICLQNTYKYYLIESIKAPVSPAIPKHIYMYRNS